LPIPPVLPVINTMRFCMSPPRFEQQSPYDTE
jgi:hypothetical protein